MRRTHAVVTGGAGFLGSHLCERLLLDGYEVLCVDNLLTGREANLLPLREIGPLHVHLGDVGGCPPIRNNVDLVVHLASPASPTDYIRFPIETLKSGAFGTWHTLELAREKKSKYVLASSSEVYGTRWYTRNPSLTGAMSTPSEHAAPMTNPSASPNR